MMDIRRKAKHVLNYALKKVPFYNKRKKLYINKKWREIPTITRKELEKYWKDFLSVDYKNYNLRFRLTTGTSGKPLKVFYNPIYYWQMNLSYFKTLITCGYNLKKIILHYDPFHPQKYFFQKLNIYRKIWINPSLSEKDQLFIISKFSKAYLSYFPTSLLFLLFENKFYNFPLTNKFYKIFTEGEILLNPIREFIENQFNSKIIDFYGVVEHGLVAYETDKNFYILPNEVMLLEVVDKNNEQVSEGERGRILLTTLGNLAFPLIRYEVDDFCTLEKFDKYCKAISDINRKSLENVLRMKKSQIKKLVNKGIENRKKFVIIYDKKNDRFEITYKKDFLIKKRGKYELIKIV